MALRDFSKDELILATEALGLSVQIEAMASDNREQWAENVYIQMRRKRITKVALAEKIGTSREFLTNVLNGKEVCSIEYRKKVDQAIDSWTT